MRPREKGVTAGERRRFGAGGDALSVVVVGRRRRRRFRPDSVCVYFLTVFGFVSLIVVV
jgi:hypothetical protein